MANFKRLSYHSPVMCKSFTGRSVFQQKRDPGWYVLNTSGHVATNINCSVEGLMKTKKRLGLTGWNCLPPEYKSDFLLLKCYAGKNSLAISEFLVGLD